jgi:hypothetical protein
LELLIGSPVLKEELAWRLRLGKRRDTGAILISYFDQSGLVTEEVGLLPLVSAGHKNPFSFRILMSLSRN